MFSDDDPPVEASFTFRYLPYIRWAICYATYLKLVLKGKGTLLVTDFEAEKNGIENGKFQLQMRKKYQDLEKKIESIREELTNEIGRLQ